jgi:enoyl-CoA hydratase/carnithine racemase
MTMSVVDVAEHGAVMVVTLNRPERLNALNDELRREMGAAFRHFRDSGELEVAILTGAGRAFCAGEDMKEALTRGRPGLSNPFWDGTLEKPVIAAVNGFAMGGGFMVVERCDMRVAVQGAVFEVSEAKRWLLGGFNHGFIANLPHAVAMEMAFGYRFTAERMHELGFVNRLTSAEDLLPEAMGMARHLLTLPPASRVNTLVMMRAMQPRPGADQEKLAAALREHGAKSDLMESRAAFAEKREPRFKGWDDPADRYRTPNLQSIRGAGM